MVRIIKTTRDEKESNLEKINFYNDIEKFFEYSPSQRDILTYKNMLDNITSRIKNYQDESYKIMNEIKKRTEEKFYFPDFDESFNKLLENLNVESVSCKKDYYGKMYLNIVTKNIKVWKWNWGQYEIKYKEHPAVFIDRIGKDSKINSLIAPYLENEFIIINDIQHPHISSTPCFGSISNLIYSFWDDYNKGFNYCIQYLRSYSRRGAFQPLFHFLALLGYVNDASIIAIHHEEIAYIINGVLYDNYDKIIPFERLKEWGCNGKLITKKEINKIIKNSRYTKKADAIKKGIKYIPQINDNFSYMYQDEFEYLCESCGEPCNEIYSVQETNICECCYENNTIMCENCDESYFNDYISYYDEVNKYICDNCIDELRSSCDYCGEYFFELIDSGLGSYCEDCYNKIQEETEEQNKEDKPHIKILGVIKK